MVTYNEIARANGGALGEMLDNGRRMVSNAGKSPKGNVRSASDNGEKVSG